LNRRSRSPAGDRNLQGSGTGCHRDRQWSGTGAHHQAKAEAEALGLIAAALKDNPDLLTYQYISKLAPNVSVMYLPSGSPFILQIPQNGHFTCNSVINSGIMTNDQLEGAQQCAPSFVCASVIIAIWMLSKSRRMQKRS